MYNTYCDCLNHNWSSKHRSFKSSPFETHFQNLCSYWWEFHYEHQYIISWVQVLYFRWFADFKIAMIRCCVAKYLCVCSRCQYNWYNQVCAVYLFLIPPDSSTSWRERRRNGGGSMRRCSTITLRWSWSWTSYRATCPSSPRWRRAWRTSRKYPSSGPHRETIDRKSRVAMIVFLISRD